MSENTLNLVDSLLSDTEDSWYMDNSVDTNNYGSHSLAYYSNQAIPSSSNKSSSDSSSGSSSDSSSGSSSGNSSGSSSGNSSGNSSGSSSGNSSDSSSDCSSGSSSRNSSNWVDIDDDSDYDIDYDLYPKTPSDIYFDNKYDHDNEHIYTNIILKLDGNTIVPPFKSYEHIISFIIEQINKRCDTQNKYLNKIIKRCDKQKKQLDRINRYCSKQKNKKKSDIIIIADESVIQSFISHSYFICRLIKELSKYQKHTTECLLCEHVLEILNNLHSITEGYIRAINDIKLLSHSDFTFIDDVRIKCNCPKHLY